MNIIFLDVDGVINSVSNMKLVLASGNKQLSGINYPFDERCLRNLKMIVEVADAYIVITSVFRKNPKHLKVVLQKLEEYDLVKRVIGLTPVLNTTKGDEIKAYLASIGQPCNFVILDDDNDVEELAEHLIKTNEYNGLTQRNAEEAIKKLVPDYKKNL